MKRQVVIRGILSINRHQSLVLQPTLLLYQTKTNSHALHQETNPNLQSEDARVLDPHDHHQESQINAAEMAIVEMTDDIVMIVETEIESTEMIVIDAVSIVDGV